MSINVTQNASTQRQAPPAEKIGATLDPKKPIAKQKIQYLEKYNRLLIEANPDDKKNKWKRGEIANRITRLRQ